MDEIIIVDTVSKTAQRIAAKYVVFMILHERKFADARLLFFKTTCNISIAQICEVLDAENRANSVC